MKRSKKYRQAQEKLDRTASYDLPDAIGILRDNKVGKFDETVEVSMRLGVDPKHADQVVRGTVALPHGTGRTVRVLVLAKGEKESEATEAGADFAGSDDFIQKIQDGWLDFDAVVATPDMMGQVGKLGRVLGPRGLMPNPKLGTVTFEVGKAVRELKAGKIEYRVDRNGNMAAGVGKLSFEPGQIAENVTTFIDAIVRAKPTAAKGQYVRNITLTSTMGVGVKLDSSKLLAGLKQ